jgi:hypothetical protein
MGILFSRAAVGGPAGVANAVSSVQRTEADRLLEVAQLTFGSTNLEFMTFSNYRNAGGIIASILEFAQSIDYQWHNLFISDIPDYSTHMFSEASGDS